MSHIPAADETPEPTVRDDDCLPPLEFPALPDPALRGDPSVHCELEEAA